MAEALEQFKADWLPRLNAGAKTVFEYGTREDGMGLHSSVADSFVEKLGYKAIGFNWELLDAAGEMSDPRSAMGEITSAIAKDISNPSKDWLGEDAARKGAEALIGAFDRGTLTVVSNRYDGLWNPISGAPVEWAFVCFDDSNIALLLITEA